MSSIIADDRVIDLEYSMLPEYIRQWAECKMSIEQLFYKDFQNSTGWHFMMDSGISSVQMGPNLHDPCLIVFSELQKHFQSMHCK